MPDFTNPFPGMRQEGDLDNEEIIRALRLDIAAEQDATHIYTAQAYRIKNPAVRHSLLDIANEEKVHSGELMRLIMHLDPEEMGLLDKGFGEVEKREDIEHQIVLEMFTESIRESKKCPTCVR